jgi:hypothetical protein
MKKLITIPLALLLMVIPVKTEPQEGSVITITAGTAIRLIANAGTVQPVIANSLLIQPLHGGSGIVYVLNCSPSLTNCAKGSAGTTLVAELPPATSTAPSTGSFTFPSNGTGTQQGGGFDVRYWAIDGGNSGDTVATSWDVKR